MNRLTGSLSNLPGVHQELRSDRLEVHFGLKYQQIVLPIRDHNVDETRAHFHLAAGCSPHSFGIPFKHQIRQAMTVPIADELDLGIVCRTVFDELVKPRIQGAYQLARDRRMPRWIKRCTVEACLAATNPRMATIAAIKQHQPLRKSIPDDLLSFIHAGYANAGLHLMCARFCSNPKPTSPLHAIDTETRITIASKMPAPIVDQFTAGVCFSGSATPPSQANRLPDTSSATPDQVRRR